MSFFFVFTTNSCLPIKHFSYPMFTEKPHQCIAVKWVVISAVPDGEALLPLAHSSLVSATVMQAVDRSRDRQTHVPPQNTGGEGLLVAVYRPPLAVVTGGAVSGSPPGENSHALPWQHYTPPLPLLCWWHRALHLQQIHQPYNPHHPLNYHQLPHRSKNMDGSQRPRAQQRHIWKFPSSDPNDQQIPPQLLQLVHWWHHCSRLLMSVTFVLSSINPSVNTTSITSPAIV